MKKERERDREIERERKAEKGQIDEKMKNNSNSSNTQKVYQFIEDTYRNDVMCCRTHSRRHRCHHRHIILPNVSTHTDTSDMNGFTFKWV